MNIYFTYLEEAKQAALVAQYMHKLPIKFQEKLNKFRSWKDAQASLLGRLLLAKALQEVYQIPLDFGALEYEQYGKPKLSTSNINFNISHSGNLVVCAVAENQQIGIDVEHIRKTSIIELRSQMTTGEWQRIQQSEDKYFAFYEYWTSKEAVLKASGKGFSLPLKSFEVDWNKNFTQADHRNWYLQKIDLDALYLCYLASDKPIKVSAIIKLSEF